MSDSVANPHDVTNHSQGSGSLNDDLETTIEQFESSRSQDLTQDEKLKRFEAAVAAKVPASQKQVEAFVNMLKAMQPSPWTHVEAITEADKFKQFNE